MHLSLVLSLYRLVFTCTTRIYCMYECLVCVSSFELLPSGVVVKTGTGTQGDAGASTCSTATYSAGLQYFQCVSQSSQWNQCCCD